MWHYERKMPWEKGGRIPFCSTTPRALPPRPKTPGRVQPAPAPPPHAAPGGPLPGKSPVPTAPSGPAPSPAKGETSAPAAPERQVRRPRSPGRAGKGLSAKPGKRRPKKRRVDRKARPGAPNPFAGIAGETDSSGTMLAAEFPEMEAATKKPSEEELRAAEARQDAEEASQGDPLLSDSQEDQWAASDTFRETRRELTRKHRRREAKKDKEFLGGGGGSETGGDATPLLGGGEGDEWASSDSGKMAPIRGLEGLGAHDEDQFEDEAGSGLGTRLLAREADQMERDAVDEEFFSDIDISDEDYAEASRSALKEDEGDRVVRRIEDTQVLDYQAFLESDIFSKTDLIPPLDDELADLDDGDEEEDLGESGLPLAHHLDEVAFARALSRLPSGRLALLVDNMTGSEPAAAERLSREEFEAYFGPS